MATVVLQVAGTVIGGAIGGPIGAAIGQAVGAAAGYMIDRELFGPDDRAIEGPRLKNAQFLSSEEGTPIPRVYGRTRLSGQIIWATRFEEVQETESQGGGKGGPKTYITSYSYFANLAIGLCEGEVATIRRIWVDGKLLNQNNVTIRLHKGTADQLPDSLIEAKQGAGNAPAYRGLAYVVFERLPLEDYGNRIPQIAVEIIKPVGQLEKRIKAVALLPGASEFGYDPEQVTEKIDAQTINGLNNHNTIAESDWAASMDELQALCPNLASVALISSWFGDDLRAGECRCAPRVETAARQHHQGESWQVSGISRSFATVVSLIDDKPAFGGTPSDGSIIRAIRDIHQRGLKVTFYPFLMMDIADTNTKPDPYGGTNQATYPWRGRITCHPAIGQPATVDKTSAAKTQIDAFAGLALPAEFSNGTNTINYSGTEWSYRRMILHYAKLCALAGGVEAFLLGSELRGLTQVQDDTGAFPFVDHLRTLAAEVRTILGPTTKISYAADWSEYFGYQPDDGSGDVHYNLDPLWADGNIDMVAIDNYMPVSDWRDDGAPDGVGTSSRDRAVMAENIAAGEGFDWYYVSSVDRRDGVRTPITDGLGKPWVFRNKDLKSWWSNEHIPRIAGVETPIPTAWLPQMKPLWFTELGCPAIDKGANQPNVFVDPKSSESHFPYHSSGNRDDAVQSSFLTAHQSHWDPVHPEFIDVNNPLAATYGARMVDANSIHLWAWDVRPYPVFPENDDLWSDGENWRLGHWLNGRLGAARLADVVADILNDHGFGEYDVSNVHGFADGYVVSTLTSARGALQSLIDLYQVEVLEQSGKLIFRTPQQTSLALLSTDVFADNKDQPQTIIKRIQETELPKSVILEHSDPRLEFQPSATHSRRIEGGSERQVSLNVPIILPQELAVPLVDDWLRAAWIGRNSVQIKLPRRFQHLQIGDQVEFDADRLTGKWLITRIEEAGNLSVDLRTIETIAGSVGFCPSRTVTDNTSAQSGLPLVQLLDLPVLSGDDAAHASRIAVSSKPWPGSHDVFSAPDDESYTYRQSVGLRATIGALKTPLAAGSAGRWDYATSFDVEILAGELSAQPGLQILNGANVAAVRSQNGGWEVLQFAGVELVDVNIWRLSTLLRGQAGTELEMAAGALAGADFVLLNSAVEPLSYEAFEVGLPLNWKIAASGTAISDPGSASLTFSPGLRGYAPLSPVHLSLKVNASDDAEFSWIRRDRINADAWSDGDIPMSEASELYTAKIKSGETVLRQWNRGTGSVSYSRADQLADIASFPANLTLEVAQVSATHSDGAPASLSFTLQ